MKNLSEIIRNIKPDKKIIEIYTNNKNKKIEVIEYKVPINPKAQPGTLEEEKYLKYLLKKYVKSNSS